MGILEEGIDYEGHMGTFWNNGHVQYHDDGDKLHEGLYFSKLIKFYS